jgi:hypothetical protein
MTEQPKWEVVAEDTDRLPVRGGWLYRTRGGGVALCFVPDAKARHMRELTRQRAAAALAEMEHPLGRSPRKREESRRR